MNRSIIKICQCTLPAFMAVSIIYANDSVWVEPSAPTDKNSLTFHLFYESGCCCAVYYNQSVSVSNKAITLGFQYDNAPCNLCECFAAGSWLTFDRGKLAAGDYAIYESESPYCPPGAPCAFPNPVVNRVGQVTIAGSTGADEKRSALEINSTQSMVPVSIEPVRAGGRLFIEVARATNITLELYTLDGGRIVSPTPSQFSQGKHSIDLRTAAPASSAIVVRLRTEGYSISRKIAILTQ
jgi:hypothetical protein